MNQFTLPFTIEPESKDYVLSKVYEEESSFKLLIPKNAHIEPPIWLKIKPTASDLRFKLTVECEAGASAVIMEEWSSDIKAGKVEFKLHVMAQPNSELKYIVLHAASSETEVKETRTTEIQTDAKCEIHSYYFGSKKVDSQLVQKAMGKAAEVNTDLITRTQDQQELNFDYEHQFIGQNGQGQMGMKAVAQDKGMVRLNGMVNITHTGGGSAGYLQQETLNLSPTTIVKATPGLKIDTNDVKAGHGSSIRNLNDEDLYYFAARGIDAETAKNLMIRGFLGAGLEKLEGWEEVYEGVKRMI